MGDRLIVQIGERRVYWDLPEGKAGLLLTLLVAEMGPAAGDE